MKKTSWRESNWKASGTWWMETLGDGGGGGGKANEEGRGSSSSIPFHQTQVNTGKHQWGHPGRTIENEGGKGNLWDL